MKDLKSGIEHLKQAKAHMSKANGIMSNSISKLEELEEENERLKDEIGALQIQPDASYMKLPLDADGEPIRIGDKMDVDGDVMNVLGYRLYNGELLLVVKKAEGDALFYTPKPSDVRHFKYEPHDSWAKLEEDMMRGTSCLYFGCAESGWPCRDCPHSIEQTGTPCWKNERIDILRRAKKFAGIEEEAQR